MRRIVAFLVAAWFGMQVGFGYIAAPFIFSYLRSKSTDDGVGILAGDMAGYLFHWVNYIGLVVWALAYLVNCGADRFKRRYFSGSQLFILLLLLLTAMNEFLFTPVIVAFKTEQGHWLMEIFGGGFGMWHGISSLIYLLTSIIGFFLCLMLVRWKESIY